MSVIIDECVTSRLEMFLRDKGLTSPIIGVSHSEFKGRSDEYLMKHLLVEGDCLITKDVRFFEVYSGHKIFYQSKGWSWIYRKLKGMGYG